MNQEPLVQVFPSSVASWNSPRAGPGLQYLLVLLAQGATLPWHLNVGRLLPHLCGINDLPLLVKPLSVLASKGE